MCVSEFEIFWNAGFETTQDVRVNPMRMSVALIKINEDFLLFECVENDENR